MGNGKGTHQTDDAQSYHEIGELLEGVLIEFVAIEGDFACHVVSAKREVEGVEEAHSAYCN